MNSSSVPSQSNPNPGSMNPSQLRYTLMEWRTCDPGSMNSSSKLEEEKEYIHRPYLKAGDKCNKAYLEWRKCLAVEWEKSRSPSSGKEAMKKREDVRSQCVEAIYALEKCMDRRSVVVSACFPERWPRLL